MDFIHWKGDFTVKLWTPDALPQALTSVSNVLKAIEMLESLQFCTGNNDVSYFCLQAARKGRFMDSTGKISAAYIACKFSHF